MVFMPCGLRDEACWCIFLLSLKAAVVKGFASLPSLCATALLVLSFSDASHYKMLYLYKTIACVRYLVTDLLPL